jgi:hypothetical protein
MGNNINAYRVLVGKPEGKFHIEDLCVEGRIILNWNLMKWDRRTWSILIWLWIWTSFCFFVKHGNKSSGSIKCKKFLQHLRT